MEGKGNKNATIGSFCNEPPPTKQRIQVEQRKKVTLEPAVTGILSSCSLHPSSTHSPSPFLTPINQG